MPADGLRELRVRVAGEDAHPLEGHGGPALEIYGQDARQRARACPSMEWLGRKDSNLRMPESKSGALTNLATPQRRNLRARSRARIGTARNPFRAITRTPRADGARASGRRSPAMPGGRAASAARAACFGCKRREHATARSRHPRVRRMRAQCRERSGDVRESAHARRLADRCGHNPRKRRLFSPTACCVSIPARRKSSAVAHARPAGTTSAIQHGGSDTGVSTLADAARERGLRRRRRTERRRRASRPIAASRARGRRELPQPVEREQHARRVGAAAAQPAAQRNALGRRAMSTPQRRAASPSCSARAARTREIVVRRRSPATSRVRADRAVVAPRERDRVGEIERDEQRSRACDSRRRAGR